MLNMQIRPSIIERALQLAKSGNCRTIEDIRAGLVREDYPAVSGAIRGTVFLAQLRTLMNGALTKNLAARRQAQSG